MANPAQRSFLFGEVSPASGARSDASFYRHALRTLRNAVVMRTGGVQTRPGTQYLGSTKSDGVARLEAAVFDDDAGYVLEFGNLYLRVWLNGALEDTGTAAGWSGASFAYTQGWMVTNGATPNIYVCIADHTSAAGTEPGVGATWTSVWYDLGASTTAVFEYPTPYTTAQLDTLDIKVTALNTVTIAHASHEPATLTRINNPTSGALATEYVWLLNDIDFSFADRVPANVAVSGSSGSGWGYAVAAYGPGSEGNWISEVSGFVRTNQTEASLTGFATVLASSPRTITWSAVTGADRYLVYLTASASLAGTGYYTVTPAGATSLVDDGSLWLAGTYASGTPTEATGWFSAAGEFPSVVGACQQRLLLSGTTGEPDVVYASRSADQYNFTISDPLVDSDAMSWRQVLAGGRLNRVVDLAEVARRLVVFSSAAETVVTGDGIILRPSEINPQVISQNGAAKYPKALVINDTALYVQARGGVVRDLVPLEQSFVGSDLTTLAAHLVDGYTIDDWCYQQTPHSTIWAVRSDGTLLSLTYVRESGIVGWASHDTDGDFLSVACVVESGRDVVYAVVERTINSQTKRYVERFYDRLASVPVQLDCGKSATMTAGVVAGMSHLEGETVTVLKSDGTVLASPYNSAYTTVTVSSGGFTITGAGNGTVYVGVPIVADVETLDLDLGESTVKPGKFLVTAVGAYLESSSACFAGPEEPTTATGLTLPGGGSMQAFQVLDRNDTATTTPQTGFRMLNFEGRWGQSGSVFLRHVDPTPLTVLALVPYGTFPR